MTLYILMMATSKLLQHVDVKGKVIQLQAQYSPEGR
jgi:hypothetical protein